MGRKKITRINVNQKNRFNVVCLFARERGVKVLEGLLADGRFTILGLLVHSRLPKSEDPDRGMRPEVISFQEISRKYSIPLSTVDSPQEARKLDSLNAVGEFDFLITVSWRFLVAKEIFSRARIAAINLHRGKLPKYAGAEPVKRALLDRQEYITLCAHEMTEEIDAGKILIERNYPANYDDSKSLAENVARIKKEMLPLYPKAVIEAIEKTSRRHQFMPADL